MKNITKDNKAITLVALIITIVIMLILGSVTIYTGLDTYKLSKINAFVIEMQLIQAKVDELMDTKPKEELLQLGISIFDTTDEVKINFEEAFENGEIKIGDLNTCRYFTKDELLQIFDIEDAYSDVTICFDTREVVSAKGIEYEEIKYYTQYKLPKGQALINTTTTTKRKISFELDLSIDGLNSNVTIRPLEESEKVGNQIGTELIANGMLKYKELNESNWKVITNYTEKDSSYSVSISKSGSYVFRLEDNTDKTNYVEKTISIKLANKPKTNLTLSPYNYGLNSDSWAYVQKGDAFYVWIPRYALKISAVGSEFVKGNSNITTSNTYLDDTWSVHEKFTTSDGIELTGIWVRVEEPNVRNLNTSQLLNSDAETLIEILDEE